MNLANTLAKLKLEANIWFIALNEADAIKCHELL